MSESSAELLLPLDAPRGGEIEEPRQGGCPKETCENIFQAAERVKARAFDLNQVRATEFLRYHWE